MRVQAGSYQFDVVCKSVYTVDSPTSEEPTVLCAKDLQNHMGLVTGPPSENVLYQGLQEENISVK